MYLQFSSYNAHSIDSRRNDADQFGTYRIVYFVVQRQLAVIANFYGQVVVESGPNLEFLCLVSAFFDRNKPIEEIPGQSQR